MGITFDITRMSDRPWHTKSPCDEAVDTGERRELARDMFANIYTVSFETLDELMAFVNKYRGVMIDAAKDGELPVLQIHDEWEA